MSHPITHTQPSKPDCYWCGAPNESARKLESLIAELRELHKQRTPDWLCPDIGCNCTEPFCWDCGEVWPCRTIKTLDRYDKEADR